MTRQSIPSAPKSSPVPPSHTDVLIVGAGPTGLTLAAALRLRGVAVTVIDRQPQGSNTSRAAVVHARTLEVLETIGAAERLDELGIAAPRFTIRDRDRVLVDLRFDDLPTRYPYSLMVSQAVTERVLHDRLVALGGQVLRPRMLVGVTQDSGGVDALLDDGSRVRARYLVGADGMHSTVREQAQIPFTGGAYAESFVLADVRLEGGVVRDEVILYFSPAGMVVVAPLPGGYHRVVATLDEAPENPDVALVQQLLDTRGPEGKRAVVKELVWSSRFHIHHRVADHYRSGRLVLAGDAAHVHSPAGGQGMNAGILDAMSLADALARSLAGDDVALDRYSEERRPIAAQIVRMADVLTRLATTRPRLRWLRNVVLWCVAKLPAFRRRFALRLSGLVYR
ncbi:MAG: FAD-dependent oxidoreductase [Sandaracinaceae bacterium]|nr:FAD-dependent oxidoreductase [Myxococcales bacterium]MCB9656032.1 FAD-dependent oxidoreductase [Sandaracinaceae bacterium]